MHKGIMGEVFYYKTALNVKNAKAKPLLYLIAADCLKEIAEYVDTTLLLPIFTSTHMIRAVIEVSNSKTEIFSFDEEYYGIILSRFVGFYFEQLTTEQVLLSQIKFHARI